MEYCEHCIWVRFFTPWGIPVGVPKCVKECEGGPQPSGQIYNNENGEQ